MLVPQYPTFQFVERPRGTRRKPAVRQFGAYLQKQYPQLYQRIMAIRPELLQPGLSGLGQESFLSKWGTQLLDVVKVALPIYAQDKVLRAQIKRAERGLPPLEPSQITAPPIPIQVQLPPGVEREATGALAGFKNVALWAGLGIGALVLMMAMRPRGRRA